MGGGIVGQLKAVVGPALVAFATTKVWGFAKDAVASFSELEDSSAAAAVVFSGNLDRISALSTSAGSTLGLSSQQVVNSASMFGTYGKAAGLAGEDLESFAVDFTQLAGDMASFKGTSTEDAITAVGAALRGEMEPIRNYGVMLDDATMRQKALELGLISSTKEALTPQNKTLAAQALIFEKTKDAQGDFARTAMSTANVAKTLAAESENLSAKVGSFLAPAFTAVRLKALEGVRGMSGFLDKVGSAQKLLAGGATSGDVAKSLGVTGPALAFISEGIGSVRAFTSAWRDGATDVTSSGVAGFFEGLGGTLGRVHAGLTIGADEVRNLGSEIDPLVGTVFNLKLGFQEVVKGGVGDFFRTVGEAVGPLVPQVLELFKTISPLGMVFQALGPVLPALGAAFGSFASSMGSILGGTISALLPVLTQLSSLLIDSLGQVFVALAPVVVSMLGQLATYFGQLAPVVVSIVTVVVQLAGELLSALMPILVELMSTVLPVVAEIFGTVLAAVVPLVQEISGFLIPVIQALLPVVVVVFQAVAQVITNVMQIVKGVIDVAVGLISGNWGQVWRGMGTVLSGVWNLVVSLIRGALALVGQLVISGIGLAVNFIRSAFQGVLGFLGGIWGGITSGVSGMVGDVLGFFRSLPGKILGALGNVGRVLWDAGRNIVQGLINGIGSMLGAIGRAVLNIVPEAIRGPFEQLMGIHSPSEVTTWWGEMLGAGVVKGVDGSTPDVARSVARLAKAAAPPSVATQGSRSTYLPPAGVGGGGDGDNLTIEVHGDMFGDAREVAAELEREKKRAVQVHNIDQVAAGV